MAFLGKSYGEWYKVEVPVFLPITYDGFDDKEEVFDHKIVPETNDINNYYNVINSDKDSKEGETLLDQQIDEEAEVEQRKFIDS